MRRHTPSTTTVRPPARRVLLAWASAVLGAMALSSCASSATATPSPTPTAPATATATADADLHTPPARLSGAGSTFDAPFFAPAFAAYHRLNPAVTVGYAAVGSGAGIARFSAGQVDFGASDVPMTGAEQQAARGGAVVQVPVALGGVTLSYNLMGVADGLHLTGPVLARIYRGQITHWDDPAITALNPGVSLSHLHITVIHRSDSSGTTYIFTSYLAAVDSDWAGGPGAGRTVSWPAGTGAPGNAGVAATIKAVPGALGYLELSYAMANNITYADVQNHDGKFAAPNPATVAAAAAARPGLTPQDFSIVNETGPASYPISGYSWALAYQHQPSAATGAALVKMLDWLTHAGQQQAQAADYVPLPLTIQQLARTTLTKITDPHGTRLLR